MNRSGAWWVTVALGMAPVSAWGQTARQAEQQAERMAPLQPVEAPPAPTLPAALTAQPGGMTADMAAARAVRTSLQVRAAHAQTEAADSARTEAGLGMIPQISLSARYTRLSEIQQASLGSPTPTPLLLGATRTSPPPCVTENGSVIAGMFGAPSPGSSIPSVQCSAGARPLSNPPSAFSFPVILDQIAFRGTLTIPLSDIPFRLARIYEAAGLTQQARRLDEESAREQAALDARVSFYEYIHAMGVADIARDGVVAARRHREDLAHFVEAGTIARVELLRVEAQVAEAERSAIIAREAMNFQEALLRQRIHVPAEEHFVLGESLDGPVEIPSDVRPLIDRALRERPELASLERQNEALGANLAATRTGMFTSLVGQVNLDIANPNQRYVPQAAEFNTTWDASLQLTWSPTGAIQTGATASRIAAQRDGLRAQLSAMREGYELEVRSAWMQMQGARAGVESAGRQLAAAEESYRVRRERFLAGAATSADLTDAENDLQRARYAQVDSHITLRINLARLRRATGARTTR